MTSFWPWLVVASLGALHGLNPSTGWMLAVAWGVQSRDRWLALPALVPIAAGHAASLTLVAIMAASGRLMDRPVVQGLAGGALMVVVVFHLYPRCTDRNLGFADGYTTHAGLVLWSFMMATAHGAGLMLVPALTPLCVGDGPIRAITASGSLPLAIAAVGIHTGAMLVVTGVMATGVCRGVMRGAAFARSRAVACAPPVLP